MKQKPGVFRKGMTAMKIIKETTEFHIEEQTAVAIGKFDGIHIGHRRLLEQVLAQKKKGLKACIFTFDPPPSQFFGMGEAKELTSREEKRHLFARIGIDVLVEFPLNEKTAAITPQSFIRDVLAGQLWAGFIAAGTDVSFGDKGAGNSSLLEAMQKECGYRLEIIDKVCYKGREVSSTYVREKIREGSMEEAFHLMGGPYPVYGQIVHGRKIGRTIGMPTINQLPPEGKLLPPNGVYFSEVEIEGRRYKGITNIGSKPTVSKVPVIGVETYIYNFNQEIYGDMAEVRLYAFKRPEQKFSGIEELKKQMKEDIREGIAYRFPEEKEGLCK